MVQDVKLKPGYNLAIDPGNIGSGWIIWVPDERELSGIRIVHRGRDRNIHIRKMLAANSSMHRECHIQIETPMPSGMPTPGEVMQTLIEIGRFLAFWRGPWTYVSRGSVKLRLTGQAAGKDKNVNAAIKEVFGGEAVAIGGKKCPQCKGNRLIGKLHCPKCGKSSQKENDCGHCDGGKNKAVYKKRRCPECRGKGVQSKTGPLKGVAEHEWAALGVALYWHIAGDADVHTISHQQNLNKQKKKWQKKPTTSRSVPR